MPKVAFESPSVKRPAFEVAPDVKKLPAFGPAVSSNEQNPSWRIARLDLVDPFGWHTVDGADELHKIRQKLKEFEEKTWNEILVKEKKRNHTVSVSDICPEALKRLQALNLDDLEEVVSLRLSGAERIWGFRAGPVMTLLWWDPTHRVCPSLKKNT